MTSKRCPVLLVAVSMVMSTVACTQDAEELPRNHKYNVPHPVYSWDHSVWNAVRSTEDADEWVVKSNEELRSHITEVGVWDGDNARMRLVLQSLARKYGETGDERYAYKAAVILHRYSEVISKWGWRERSPEPGRIHPHDVMIPRYGRQMPPHYAGFWSSWHPYDLHQSAPLVLAYDQIYSSGQMERLGQELGIADLRLHLERHLLYYNLSINDRYPLSYGNTEANRFLGMLLWGKALGDPELVHRAIRFADNMIKISYYACGFWHEVTPAYHMMITGRWATYFMMVPLDEYSDPPGYADPVSGERFDGADFRARYWPHLDRAAVAMQQFILPNGYYAAINDSTWDSNTADRWDCYGVLRNYRPDQSKPVLMTWAGHAVLGQGSGEDQVQARLNFAGAYGHDHLDALNFFLWAKNIEILSETDYRALGQRSWAGSTAAHNTVVIDEQDQFHRSNAPQRVFTELDDVPGVEDFDFARKSIHHGTCLTDGQLRLFATDGPNGLQVVEVDGQRAYPAEICQVYRRTLCLVQSSGPDVYLVDIFRVRGGSTHDWMLHGPLQNEYTVQTSVPLTPREGTLHEHIRNLSSAATDETWSATFTADSGETVRTIMLGGEESEVIVGQAHPMRREGLAEFLDVRRAGPDSVFVAVHEPYTGAPKVLAARLLPLTIASGMAVAVEIELEGRTDVILSQMDADSHMALADTQFSGRFGYLSRQPGQPGAAYMADASRLMAPGVSLDGQAAFTGTVTATLGTDRGDEHDAFITDSALPTDGNLIGRLLLTEDGDGTTRGFFVQAIRATDDGHTMIQVDRLPGMTVEEGYVKLQYFPNWGIPGELGFRIVNTGTLQPG